MADMEVLQSDISSKNGRYMALWQAGDSEALAQLQTEECRLMAPGYDTGIGRPAAAAIYAGILKGPKTSISLKTEELMLANPEVAIERGIYTIKGQDGGIVDKGKTAVLWRKVNGGFLMHCNMWNTNLPNN